jgi:hypothetical protein
MIFELLGQIKHSSDLLRRGFAPVESFFFFDFVVVEELISDTRRGEQRVVGNYVRCVQPCASFCQEKKKSFLAFVRTSKR